MQSNVIVIKEDKHRRLVCQFVIDLSSKEDVEAVIKTIREITNKEIKTEEKQP